MLTVEQLKSSLNREIDDPGTILSVLALSLMILGVGNKAGVTKEFIPPPLRLGVKLIIFIINNSGSGQKFER